MFNVFKKVLDTKSVFTDEDINKVSDFVFCRWLEGNYGTLQIAQMFNVYSNIPKDVKLKVAKKIINGRIKFIPYIKSEKNSEDNLSYISEYFNISLQKAKMYSEFISKEDLAYITDCINRKHFSC